MIPIEFGPRIIEKRIDQVGENEIYTFEAVAGNILRLRLFTTTSSEVDAGFELYNPDGTLLDARSGENREEISNGLELTQDGTYTIIVSDYQDDEIGDYILDLQRINNPVKAESINFGDEPIEDSIATIGEENFYNFEAVAGDILRLKLFPTKSSEVDPGFLLYNPDDTQLDSRSGENREAISNGLKLTQDGTYTIIVNDFENNEIGDYILDLQRINNPVNASSINFGKGRENSIDVMGDEDFYTFEAVAGDLIRLSTTRLSDVDPGFELYNPDGTLLDDLIMNSETDNSVVLNRLELTQDGTYTIIVSDFEDNETGDYAINLQLLNNLVNESFLGNDSNDLLNEETGNYRLNGIGDNDSLLDDYGNDPLTASKL